MSTLGLVLVVILILVLLGGIGGSACRSDMAAAITGSAALAWCW